MLKRKISNRKYFFLLAGVSIIVMVLAVVLAVYTIMNANRSLGALDKSHDISKKLERLMSAVKDAEAGLRGYLLTGKPIFWETYKKSKIEVERNFSDLDYMLPDNDEQRINLEQLKNEIDIRLGLLYENKTHFDRTKAVSDSLKIKIEAGRLIMDRVKYKAQKIEQIEESKLGQIQKITFKSSKLSVYIILLTCGLSLLLLIMILVVLGRELRSRTAIEKELIASEKLLQQQVHMLNLSNKELEQFAYVASHDLQEPLRKIISFSEKIQHKLSGNTDQEISDSLRRLGVSAGRMRVLIDDLLNYSRVTRNIETHEEVKLETIMKFIIEDLGVTIASKKASISVDKLETVVGNSTQLRQLFQNLISNALKFNKSGSPVIQVWGKNYHKEDLTFTGWKKGFNLKHNEYYCVFVKDNGIGFDLQYVNQIFVIFNRLHGRSEYEGTGIGLAICKRIVENHEGFIAAESETGKGSTFIVGLPVKKLSSHEA